MGTFKEQQIEALDDIWKALDALQASFLGLDQEEDLFVSSEGSGGSLVIVKDDIACGENGDH